jgi:hypothetical protein
LSLGVKRVNGGAGAIISVRLVRKFRVLCTDEAGNIGSAHLLICRVSFSFCDSVASPQATPGTGLGTTVKNVQVR